MRGQCGRHEDTVCKYRLHPARITYMETPTFDPAQLADTIFTKVAGEYAPLLSAMKPVFFIAIAAYVIFRLVKFVIKFIPVPKDSIRMYTKGERMHGFARADYRCEMEGFLWFRCGKEAKHGDHHYPHSRGGATTMKNFVAACVKCNTSKGAKVPTRFATWRLQNRRKAYFPKGQSVVVGERVKRKAKVAA